MKDQQSLIEQFSVKNKDLYYIANQKPLGFYKFDFGDRRVIYRIVSPFNNNILDGLCDNKFVSNSSLGLYGIIRSKLSGIKMCDVCLNLNKVYCICKMTDFERYLSIDHFSYHHFLSYLINKNPSIDWIKYGF